LRWRGLGDFLVRPGGDEVLARSDDRSIRASFEAYLFNQVLSFALVQMGREPLHATVIEADGTAVGLVGPPGAGKSTLAAALLARGFRLVTDDLLLVEHTKEGPSAQLGLARLKLYPKVSEALLPDLSPGPKLNPNTAKEIFPLPRAMRSRSPQLLHALFVLHRRKGKPGVTLRRLGGKSSFATLTANTFNPVDQTQQRLSSHLPEVARIVREVPVKALHYGNGVSRIEDACAALEREIA